MLISLIANPASGRGLDPDDLVARLTAAGARVTERPEDADRIVVCGGDGTLGAAAELAARRGVPLAVIPGGTANDFARAHDLPSDVGEAVALAATGARTQPLELARMGGVPFVNVASTGLSPAAARRAAPLKRALGPGAYPLAGLAAGLREHPVRLTAIADGQEVFTGGAWQLTVASTGAFGGGASVGAADPRDGLLDLVVVPAGSRLGLPGIAVAMRRGRLTAHPGTVHVRADAIRVRTAPRTPFNVDGENVQGGPEITFSATAAAFSLVIPGP